MSLTTIIQRRGGSLCTFFFSSRRRHTRCSRDWSSDVCSSDLFSVCTIHRLQSQAVQESGPLEGFGATPGVPYQAMSTRPSSPATGQANTLLWRGDRERGGEGKSVDLGGGRII